MRMHEEPVFFGRSTEYVICVVGDHEKCALLVTRALNAVAR
ncbi:hypothetical protein APHNP_0344 [Anaplasma phagocytophilum str. ApNP]|uniref:Uncharacterized protein n=1 Tax=Anaplasma phagocytophilum str. ApNP TaxID=1359153 RepID=A0A0F3NIZ6_ANAPH|nr:hypothetical protein APHNP_0344 [Anaplasma phagocytophilum str. ApNP]